MLRILRCFSLGAPLYQRAPDGTGITTKATIDKHILDGKVGGRFIKLPCAAATYYKAKGWILTAE